MKLAFVALPTAPGHRAPGKEVAQGVAECGDCVEWGYAGEWDRERYDDCAAIVWTDRARNGPIVARQRELGGKVIVMENGYLARADGERTYSFELDGCNGRGRPLPDDCPPDRWRALGHELSPWRKGRKGSHVLVCGQRGMGPPGISHDRDWLGETIAAIRDQTGRRIVYRPHPLATVGAYPALPEGVEVGVSAREPLGDALDDCWAVVVYASKAAVEALMRGVPVFTGVPCMATTLGRLGIDGIEDPAMPEGRETFFRALAYAQWSRAEIARGEAWRHLMYR